MNFIIFINGLKITAISKKMDPYRTVCLKLSDFLFIKKSSAVFFQVMLKGQTLKVNYCSYVVENRN